MRGNKRWAEMATAIEEGRQEDGERWRSKD